MPNEIVPDGDVGPVVEVSVTVAVQLVAWLTTTVEGVHETVVVVVASTIVVTETVVVPELISCVVSPP